MSLVLTSCEISGNIFVNDLQGSDSEIMEAPFKQPLFRRFFFFFEMETFFFDLGAAVKIEMCVRAAIMRTAKR